MGAAGERPEIDTKSPLGAILLIFFANSSSEVVSTRGNFRKAAGVLNQSFPLIGELPKAIEPNMPAYQIFR